MFMHRACTQKHHSSTSDMVRSMISEQPMPYSPHKEHFLFTEEPAK